MNLPNWESRLIYNNRIFRTTGLTLSAAILIVLSYAPSPFSFFIFIGFIPFLRLLEDKSVWESFRYGYLLGLIINLIVFYWFIYFKFSTYLLMAFLNPLQFATFAVIYSSFKSKKNNLRLFFFPIIWTAIEYFRELGDLAMNWLNIGYTQANFLPLIQFAEFTGLNGITFWICLINLMFYLLIFNRIPKTKKYVIGFILLFLFLIPLLHGILKLNNKITVPGISATYIQPNINSKTKWNKSFMTQNVKILHEMSKNASPDKNDLIIWPETAIPFPLQEIEDEIDSLKKFANKKEISLLTGILNHKDNLIKHNSTVLISKNYDSLQVYNKIKLVPLEEGLPFKNFYFNLLSDSMMSKYYSYGTNHKVLELSASISNLEFDETDWKIINKQIKVDKTKIASVICIESAFSGFISEFVKNGAKILVVVTNDEWFGYSPQSLQHLFTSRIRAIENRVSVIHCSNAGISAFVDPFGRFYEQSQLFEKTIGKKIIPLNIYQTFFTKHGDLIGKFCFYITLVLIPVYFILKRYYSF